MTVDQSRGGSYIDDGDGPVHVDDLPKVDAPQRQAVPDATPAAVTLEEPTDA